MRTTRTASRIATSEALTPDLTRWRVPPAPQEAKGVSGLRVGFPDAAGVLRVWVETIKRHGRQCARDPAPQDQPTPALRSKSRQSCVSFETRAGRPTPRSSDSGTTPDLPELRFRPPFQRLESGPLAHSGHTTRCISTTRGVSLRSLACQTPGLSARRPSLHFQKPSATSASPAAPSSPTGTDTIGSLLTTSRRKKPA
jgi:hypothetical protein